MKKEIVGITKEEALSMLSACKTIKQWSDVAYEIKKRCYDKDKAILSLADAKQLNSIKLDEICNDMIKNDHTNKVIRLCRGDEDSDKLVEVTIEEYVMMAKYVAKYGTLYDADMTEEDEDLIYSDIEERKDLIPETYDTFYMRER